ncbi:MAG: c-type cytochrome [Bdellovibrionales bacterium]|nr:c-type cytochrome [Bdellovibrionales bacterium]
MYFIDNLLLNYFGKKNEGEISVVPSMGLKPTCRYAAVVLMMMSLIGCNAKKDQTNIELIQDMMDQISVKAQDWDADKPEMRANLVPPEKSVPRNVTPYKYSGKPLDAETKLENPLRGNFSPQVLELGKKKFDIYCAICHGSLGRGDGSVAPKMILPPPSLMSQKVIDFKDGRIFHIITEGQGLMGPYSTQIVDEKSRWALVNYIRTLQKNTQTK